MDRKERQLRTGLLRFAGHRAWIELALPSRMLWQCAHSISADPTIAPEEEAFCKAVIPLLDQAMREPLADLSRDRKAEAAILINSVSDWTLQIYQGRPVPTVFMIVLRWLEGLVNTGYLVLASGSACDAALDLIFAELGNCPELAVVNKSGTKNSHRLLARLQTLNLYSGAEIPAVSGDTLALTVS